ncbi:MAG: sodium-translocating pyrophosphatase [Christensenellaceae bacterium]
MFHNQAWVWTIVAIMAVCLVAVAFIVFNYFRIKKMPEGTDRMVKISGIIRSGSNVFLKKEFKTIAIVIVVLALLFSLFIERTAGLTFILGAVMSSCVCILGMKSATYANVRTSNKARESLNIGQTVKVALTGGSISGLSVQALGLLGLALVVLLGGVGGYVKGVSDNASVGLIPIAALETNATVIRITCYSLGCSIVAMFNRVAGGNFTKAADISSDILAKIRNDLPEDDCRVPNVIADFIGDNVNDIAGNCSDLLESFVATMSATLIVVAGFLNTEKSFAFNRAGVLPLVIAGIGLLSCVVGIALVSIKKMGDNPSKELNLATYISAGLTLIGVGVACFVLFKNFTNEQFTTLGWKIKWASPWVCAVLGIASGVAIGLITEYYTSADYKPTKKIAEFATEGEAFVVTKGDAVGSRSCLYPILIIGISLLVSHLIAGTYGIAVASLGMLSFVGTTVSIDAFGPIADNAGGLAESCHLDHQVREITDKLDSVGNTTAAIGKGFAIGSAAFATVSLIVAYVGNYNIFGHLDVPYISSAQVIAGAIIGGALIEFFSAILTDNTIDAAKELADVGDRQMSDPEVLAGTKEPNYNELVELATKYALKKMLFPSILAVAIPFIGGIFFGVDFVCGILVGATIVAIPRAIFMGNSGGAFDNAKKYIESGALEGHGKGSPAHKAAVTGDTIGDTRKDVVGVALDIFIKAMSTIANTLFVVIQSIHGALFK